jgi:protein-S-isoprenylcysteine O-methyltransferase Ste14
MYNVKILFFHIGIVFCLLPLFISCEEYERHKYGLYGWEYSHYTGNVRYLLIFPDSFLNEPVQ